MKKIIIIMLLVLLCSCGSKEAKSVTCELINNDQAGVKVTYFYDDEKNITKIHNKSYLIFSEDELYESSLDNYFEMITTQYAKAKNEKGVSVNIQKEETENKITMEITIVMEEYDINEDILNVGNYGEMDSIDTILDLYQASGIYSCEKLK